jgi:hypothetical protein
VTYFARANPVTYCARGAMLRAKVPQAAAVHFLPAPTHRLTLADRGSTHYRFHAEKERQ